MCFREVSDTLQRVVLRCEKLVHACDPLAAKLEEIFARRSIRPAAHVFGPRFPNLRFDSACGARRCRYGLALRFAGEG